MKSRKAVELLLEHSALIWRHGGIFGSAIHAACFKNDPQILALLLKRHDRYESQSVNFRDLAELQRYNPKNLYDFIKSTNPIAVDPQSDVKTQSALDNFVGRVSTTGPEGLVQALREEFADIPRHPLLFVACLAVLANENEYDNQGEVVRLLLDDNARIDDPTFNSILLHSCVVAATFGSAETMLLLLEAGADVKQEQRHHAVQCLVTFSSASPRPGHKACLQRLMSPDVWGNDELDDGSKTNAFVAAAHGKATEVLQVLVNAGVPLNYQDKLGMTALSMAAYDGRRDNVQILLDAGAQLEIADKAGWTALVCAARKGHADVARVLLNAGAKVDYEIDNGWTPLMHAAFGGHKDAVQVILDAEAQVDHLDRDGWTSLMQASSKGHTDVVRALLYAGAQVDHLDKNGCISLMWASFNGHTEVVKALSEAGARIDRRNNENWTALLWAAHKGHKDTVTALLDAGARIDQQNDGYTALMWAASEGHADVVQALLDAGADPSHSTGFPFWYSARYLASSNGHVDVDQILRRHGARFSFTGKAEALLSKLKSGM